MRDGPLVLVHQPVIEADVVAALWPCVRFALPASKRGRAPGWFVVHRFYTSLSTVLSFFLVSYLPSTWWLGFTIRMRFGRRSTADDDGGLPIRLPFMKRNRQPAQESKENVPPEDGDMHDSVVSSPKASRRKTVIDMFKHKGSGRKDDEEGENILTRMTAHRNKSVSVDC